MAEVGSKAHAALLRRGLNQLDEHLKIFYYSVTNFQNAVTTVDVTAPTIFAGTSID
jgi:hypothetical protein